VLSAPLGPLHRSRASPTDTRKKSAMPTPNNLIQIRTSLDAARSVVPVGMNATPMAKNMMMTFKGVITGCHDASFCWRKGSLGGLLDFSGSMVGDDYLWTTKMRSRDRSSKTQETERTSLLWGPLQLPLGVAAVKGGLLSHNCGGASELTQQPSRKSSLGGGVTVIFSLS
jgi:hypothetical protein